MRSLVKPFGWSLSPSYFNGPYANVFGCHASGSLYGDIVVSGGAVAPVINLSADYFKTLKGTGEIGNPFRAE